MKVTISPSNEIVDLVTVFPGAEAYAAAEEQLRAVGHVEIADLDGEVQHVVAAYPWLGPMSEVAAISRITSMLEAHSLWTTHKCRGVAGDILASLLAMHPSARRDLAERLLKDVPSGETTPSDRTRMV